VAADDGTRQGRARPGTITRALEIPDDSADLVAVRFKPGTAVAITDYAEAELTNRRADVAELGITDAGRPRR